MLKHIKNRAKLLIKSFPLIEHYLYEERYKTELALIKGTHKNRNNHPSIIHFSFNKAATQYVRSILNRCTVEQGMTPVGIHEYAFNSNFPFLDQLSREEMNRYKHIFKSKGYLYSVFGGMIEGIENLENYKVILATRDPRDILVSGYFSIADSHVVPSKSRNKHNHFMSKRVAAQNATIDEYVISESDCVYDIFSRYQTLLLDRYKNVYLVKYEDMISNFEIWLTDLLEYCDLDMSREVIQYLIEENEAKKPKKENITKHLRKGVAGDYKEKLQPETIQTLNNKFEPILRRYHYQQS